MNLLPSTSSIREPEARRMKRGLPPTALNARTGLSTPPGNISRAREKSLRDFEVRMSNFQHRGHQGHKGKCVPGVELVSRLREGLCGIERVVGHDDVRAGAAD